MKVTEKHQLHRVREREKEGKRERKREREGEREGERWQIAKAHVLTGLRGSSLLPHSSSMSRPPSCNTVTNNPDPYLRRERREGAQRIVGIKAAVCLS